MILKKACILLAFAPFCINAFAAAGTGAPPPSGYYPPANFPRNPAGYYSSLPVVPKDSGDVYYVRADKSSFAYTNTGPVFIPRWYVGASVFANFAMFESKHLTNGVFDASDPYSVDKFNVWQLGGFVSAGQKFHPNWRIEGELGWFGKYSESQFGVDFSIHTPYIVANGIYDTNIGNYGGMYFGLGLGAAFPTTFVDSWRFSSGPKTKTELSPMIGLMAGWQYPIANSLYLDARYRISGYWGTDHTEQWISTSNVQYDFTNKTGLVLNNTISLGVRYEF
ncbi:MAG: porin family protein [Proteobacteria bacterium]|nr:porin family protein [Pseudomonadota bacterium]